MHKKHLFFIPIHSDGFFEDASLYFNDKTEHITPSAIEDPGNSNYYDSNSRAIISTSFRKQKILLRLIREDIQAIENQK